MATEITHGAPVKTASNTIASTIVNAPASTEGLTPEQRRQRFAELRAPARLVTGPVRTI